MNYRISTREDGLNVMNFMCEHFPEPCRYPLDIYTLYCKLGQVICVEDGDKIVACCMFGMLLEDDVRRLTIVSLAVNEIYRGNGIGMFLIHEVIKLYPQEDIGLHVKQNNMPALRLYIKCKFNISKVLPGYYTDVHPPIDGWYMIRPHN